MKLHPYLICPLLDNFDEHLIGVDGLDVRVLNIEGLSVLVSDCEEVKADADNALAHAKVVWRLFEKTSPLPFRFGKPITDEQLRSFVTSNKTALVNKMEFLRGCVEMDLNLVWTRSQSASSTPVEEKVGPGTAFLREKRREIVGDERVKSLKKEVSSRLAEKLGDLIKIEIMTLEPSETVVKGRVFHVVERSRIHEYRDRVAIMTWKQPDFKLEATGPWPPYSFADIGLEFDSHFGVS